MLRDVAVMAAIAFGICFAVGGIIALIDELMHHARAGRRW